MAHTPEKILKDLKSGKYAPVYFLHGEEAYYLDTISQYIETHALNDGEKGFNQMVFYGKDTRIADVLAQARRFPMMASRQVVLVKELIQMPDWNKKESNQLLEAYLKAPQVSTILVLNHKYKTLNKNSKIYQALDKAAVVVESKRIYENQVPDWVKNYLKEQGYSIEDKAAQLLAEALGNDLGKLHSELDKLKLNLAEGDTVREDLIEKYVGISKDYNIFELQKAIALKNALKAEQIINYWKANPKKQPLIPTLSSLFNFFSKILLAYQQTDRSDNSLAKALKVNPFFVKDYKLAMQKYSLNHLVQIIGFLRIADLQAKGILSKNEDEMEILREFVFKTIYLGR